MRVEVPALFILLVLLSGCTGDHAPTETGPEPSHGDAGGPIDVFLPGTQPNNVVFDTQSFCYFCHGEYADYAPYDTWRGSLMSHAARDPLALAAIAASNKDLGDHVLVGDYCLRCHTPKGWLEGRSEPVDGSSLDPEKKDLDGIICDFCHRMVDPLSGEGLALPTNGSVGGYQNGQFVVSDKAIKRGPYEPVPTGHNSQFSQFHTDSDFCGTCHEITHPLYDNEAIEKTYTEWKYSAYGDYAPDGEETSCQDCHMPYVEDGYACNLPDARVLRDRVYKHDLAGGSYCMQDMLIYLNDFDEGTVEALERSKEKARAMLASAAELELSVDGDTLNVKVINKAGHKLPTGYPEGRNMWLNVRFLDGSGNVIKESGAYDYDEAMVIRDDEIKTYEIKPGIKYTGDPEAFPDLTGLPEGPSFHFAVNNHIFHDNRIPPLGFKNEAFEENKAYIKGAEYEDGQNWDVTSYEVPEGTVSAEVILLYQSTSREYVEYLYEANVDNSWDYFNSGEDLFEAWTETGRCPPTEMVNATIVF